MSESRSLPREPQARSILPRSASREPQASDVFLKPLQTGGAEAIKTLFATHTDAEISALMPSVDAETIRKLRELLDGKT